MSDDRPLWRRRTSPFSKTGQPTHPLEPDLGFVYGTIIVDRDPGESPDGRATGATWRNVTVFELRDGGSASELHNGQCLCAVHHELKNYAVRLERQKNEALGGVAKC